MDPVLEGAAGGSGAPKGRLGSLRRPLLGDQPVPFVSASSSLAGASGGGGRCCDQRPPTSSSRQKGLRALKGHCE